MPAKQKFKVPSANEIKESLPEKGNQFSLFKNYQNSKEKNVEHAIGNSSVSKSIPKSSSTVAETAKASKPLSKPSAALTSSKVLSSSSTTTLSSAAESTSSSVSTTSSSVTSSSSSSSLAGTTTAQATSGSLSGSTSSSKTSSSSVSTSGLPPSSSKPASSNSIIVNYRQRGNPILKHIRNVPWEFGSIVPDYVMGVANCALFLRVDTEKGKCASRSETFKSYHGKSLSVCKDMQANLDLQWSHMGYTIRLRYHQLHPEYLHNRLKELGKGYDLRVLLVQVDVKDPHHQLKDLAKICILADLTLILAFSPEEAGRYLEAYKVYENKPAEVLMEKTETDFSSKLTECLTTVKSVNKTDSMTLFSAFKSMDGIINASKEDISLCAGFGPQKAQRLYDVFHEPFLKVRKRANKTAGNSKDASPSKKPS